MKINPDCVSPLDSRYRNKIDEIASLWSDFSMTKTRFYIELEYFLYIYGVVEGKEVQYEGKDEVLNRIINYDGFIKSDYLAIKKIESETKHDIKAIEKYVTTFLPDEAHLRNKVHLGLTSQDVVSSSVMVTLRRSMDIILKKIYSLYEHIMKRCSEEKWDDCFMVARTHGQPAIPTSFGKEIMTYINRIEEVISRSEYLEINGFDGSMILYTCKFSGANGNMAAHKMYDNNIDWKVKIDEFLERYGLKSTPYITTQTDNYSCACDIFNDLSVISSILIDLCRDLWQYCSMGYLRMDVEEDQVGSSTMPQKVNPIKFENAEGNLEISEMWFNFLVSKLNKSRLQRDLSDSTVVRNFGVPLSHFYLAIDCIIEGLNSVVVDDEKMSSEIMDGNLQIFAEAIQTVLRRENYKNPYDEMKKIFRGNSMDYEQYMAIIDSLDISNEIKSELTSLNKMIDTLTGE